MQATGLSNSPCFSQLQTRSGSATSSSKGRIRQVPEYAEAQRLNAEDGLKWLDEELANRRYIAGDKFTIADITVMIAVDFGRVSKIAIKPEQKNLARWHADVAVRPSAKA